MSSYPKQTIKLRPFFMVLASDSKTGATGLSPLPAVQIRKPGGAFAAAVGAVTELGFGWYQVALTVVDTDTVGTLAFHVTAATCDATDFEDEVTSGGTASSVIDFSAGAVAICSNALLMNGDQTVNSLLDDSDRARTVANLYALVVGHVQSAHTWNCCRTRVQLNPDISAPAFDYAYQFTLPGDFLRIISVGLLGEEVDYELEAGKVLCDEPVLSLRYLFYNTVETTWTKLLVSAVTMAMRQVLAYPITQSTSLEALIDQAIEPMLQRARTIDSQDRPAQTLGDFRLVNSRLYQGGSW